METVTVEILNQKAYKLLEDLADLNVIRLHESATLASKRTFGFAKEMIHRIDDNFNDPLDDFLSTYRRE